MNLFKLFGTVELQGVKESIANVQNLSQQVEGVAKADNKWNSGMKQTAKTVGTVAAVVGGATTAVVAYTKKTMDFVTQKSAELDVIDKGSQRMGISAEKYQEWDFVLSQNGASIARMDMGMKTLTERMRMGDEAFEQLSVSIYNADGSLRNTGDVMQETIFALADMEDAPRGV